MSAVFNTISWPTSQTTLENHLRKRSHPLVQIIYELIVQRLGIHHLSAMHFHAESSPLLSILHVHTYHGDTVDFLGRMSQPSAHH